MAQSNLFKCENKLHIPLGICLIYIIFCILNFSYDFLVHNVSVVSLKVLRPLLRRGTKHLALEFLKKIGDLLAKILKKNTTVNESHVQFFLLVILSYFEDKFPFFFFFFFFFFFLSSINFPLNLQDFIVVLY